MGPLRVRTLRITLLAGLLVLLAGCATARLAPLYDQALVEGLTEVNAETMELMALAADGTTKATFPEREPRYGRLIGRVDALALQAAARPLPSNNVLAAVRKIVGARGDAASTEQAVPSSTALQEISTTLGTMRGVDRKQGLTALEVKLFRGQVLIYMDQALTYESALER